MEKIYLDNAASTPLRPEVVRVMLPILEHTFGNPSSIHSTGREAFKILENARGDVARTLECSPSEIMFTGSGTEANNTAVFGVAHAYQARGKHILISSIEHHSVLAAAQILSTEGFDIEYIPVDAFGCIDIQDVIARIRPDTILISIMLANNEIGSLQPITELAKVLKDTGTKTTRPILHTDACQAVGQIPLLIQSLGADVVTLNSSKIYGPKGVGMLYVRSGVVLAPYIVGGAQESGRRAGTENLAGIVGFSHALTLAILEEANQSATLRSLRNTFIETLGKKLPHATLNGHPTKRLPNNIHISLPFVEGESLVLMLDTYGICASTGSACAAESLLPSHVLRAIGQSNELIHGSLRFTLGRHTTPENIEYTITSLAKCFDRLRSISPTAMPYEN